MRILCTECGETIDLDNRAYGIFSGWIRCKFCKAELKLVAKEGRVEHLHTEKKGKK